MDTSYVVGFKDVYPWVWSVMLGVALTLADRRGAFQSGGTNTVWVFRAKNAVAVLLNLALPAAIFGLTMIRLGPRYSYNMSIWQIFGSLYLAGAPLGAHHLWLICARKIGWLPKSELSELEQQGQGINPTGNMVFATFGFGIPAFAAVVGWRVPF